MDNTITTYVISFNGTDTISLGDQFEDEFEDVEWNDFDDSEWDEINERINNLIEEANSLAEEVNDVTAFAQDAIVFINNLKIKQLTFDQTVEAGALSDIAVELGLLDEEV